MEFLSIVNTLYAVPVGVMVCAILVYVFGFKSAEEPHFDQLTYTGDDRKPAGKKRKLKDKKSTANGHATAVGDNHAEVKSGSMKSTSKAEKSPAKELNNKAAAKQQKKQEASPLKDKPFAKQKDNKNDVETTPKLKEKKQDVVEKSPAKENNNKNAAAKPKGKGKENIVEEIKNKKNEKNLAKLKKAEGKPPGFDDGGWKEVLSSKDKKSRKKDEPEEIFTSKIGTKPGGAFKVQKARNIELVLAEYVAESKKMAEEKEKEVAKEVEEVAKVEIEVEEQKIPEKAKKAEKPAEKKKPEKEDKKKSEKQNEKKKKVEQESKGEKEVDEKIEDVDAAEEAIIAEIKSAIETTADTAVKSKKKNKKKVEVKKEGATEVLEKQREIPVEVTSKKLSESSDKSVDSPKVVKSTPVAKTVEPVDSNAEPAAVFDELGDNWKEAKVPKKNKKKVRKDQ